MAEPNTYGGIIDVDKRGRTSLARVRSQRHDRYLVEEFPDGTLVLVPAAVVAKVELAALANPDVVAAVEAAKGGGRSRP